MKLKKIKLENIRSYVSKEISFPDGITLLAGDIGSGKSTVLLAIDFALFGIRRGELSGSSLLRTGENNGCIELEFEVDDKNIIIKRTLKREADSVVQSSGYIIINNEKKEGTAVELKQWILDLLNYPKELLMKSKSLIYRYTVYTPQEEMKQILLGDKDYRLDTLRRVFGIDKYKRIKDNTKIYVNYLKSKKKEAEGKIFDLEEKKKQKEKKSEEIKEKENSVNDLLPLLGEINEKLIVKKKEQTDTEKEFIKLRNLEKEYENIKVNLKLKSESSKKVEVRLTNLNADIERIKSSLSEEDFDKEKLKEVKKKIEQEKRKIDNLKKEVNEVELKKNNSEEIKSRISKLDKCPTCNQNVGKEYKLETINRLEREIHSSDMSLEEKNSLLAEELEKFESLEKEYEELREKEAKAEALKFKKQNLKEKEREKQDLANESEKLEKEIEKLKSQESNISNELQGFSSLELKVKDIKKEIEDLNYKQKKLEIEKAGVEREIKSVKDLIKDLDKEIDRKLKIKEELSELNKLQRWLEEFFIGVVDVIERKVMLRVHSEFSNLFKNWFNILIENELMFVSLDEEFTPKINQNEHVIDYLYLSGGEKTAIALAYRLALNQVINSLVSVIKTRDLLILDEPTDGFSYEQLERMEKVLHELNTKQIILVSHESRIEGFVDNVIKLNKVGHVTEIVD